MRESSLDEAYLVLKAERSQQLTRLQFLICSFYQVRLSGSNRSSDSPRGVSPAPIPPTGEKQQALIHFLKGRLNLKQFM